MLKIYDKIYINKTRLGGKFMLFTLITILFFVVSFIMLMGLYLILVSTGIIRKKRLEKVSRYILINSVFITLIYVYQYLFM